MKKLHFKSAMRMAAAAIAAVLTIGTAFVPASADADTRVQPSLFAYTEGSDMPVNNNVYGKSHISYIDLDTDVPRTKPVVKDWRYDFGSTDIFSNRYPNYREGGSTSDTHRQWVYDEGVWLMDYDRIDSDGFLYKNGALLYEPDNTTPRTLICHTAGLSNYGERIPDTAPAVKRLLHLSPYSGGYRVPTRLYAPPGEMVKVTLSDDLVGKGYRAVVGQTPLSGLWGHLNATVGWVDKGMPRLINEFALNEKEVYIGSPLGGPIYISFMQASDKNSDIELTIEGAVNMPYFIYGQTTKDEWDELKTAPGAVFNMEIERGLFFTMPAYLIRGKTYENLTAMGDFWSKAVYLAAQFPDAGPYNINDPNTVPITMHYGSYVYRGDACSWQQFSWVNFPTHYANGAINVNNLILGGSWGNMHELNHQFQSWGYLSNYMQDGDLEISNNALSALTYMLYTDIGSARSEEGQIGSDWWNRVTDASRMVQENGNLSLYTTMQHCFGDKVFVKIANSGAGPGEWYKNSTRITGYDMEYFLKTINGRTDVPDAAVQEIKAEIEGGKEYPMFVPTACVYQTGYVYNRGTDEEEVVEMGKPFYIKGGEDKLLDFKKTIKYKNVGSEDSDIKLTSVEITKEPTYGKLTPVDGEPFKYVYTPGRSDKIDSLYLTARFNVASINYDFETTYKLCFAQNGKGCKVSEYALNTSGGNGNIKEIIQQYQAEDGTVKAEYVPERVWYPDWAGYSTDYSEKLDVAEGQITFPKPGTYTFRVRADDRAVIYGGTDKNNLKQVSEVTWATNEFKEETTFNVEIGENETFYYHAWVYNGAGKGSFALGTNFSGGESISTIGSANAMLPNADSPGINRGSSVSDIQYTYKPAQSSSMQKPYDGEMTVYSFEKLNSGKGPKENACDGKSGTQAWGPYGGSELSQYDCGVIFDLGRERTFEYIKLWHDPSPKGRGTLKDYTISVGNSPDELTEIKSGTAGHQYENQINLDRTVTARYVKVYAKTVYPDNGAYYLAISEFAIGSSITGGKVMTQKHEAFSYQGTWDTDTFGSSVQGLAEGKGEAKALFEGKGVALVAKKGAKYGRLSIKVDDNPETEVDLSAETDSYGNRVYILTGLDEDAIHTVTIKSLDENPINIDYLIVDGEPHLHTMTESIEIIKKPTAAAKGTARVSCRCGASEDIDINIPTAEFERLTDSKIRATMVIDEVIRPEYTDMNMYVSYSRDGRLIAVKPLQIDKNYQVEFTISEEYADCEVTVYVWNKTVSPFMTVQLPMGKLI